MTRFYRDFFDVLREVDRSATALAIAAFVTVFLAPPAAYFTGPVAFFKRPFALFRFGIYVLPIPRGGR